MDEMYTRIHRLNELKKKAEEALAEQFEGLGLSSVSGSSGSRETTWGRGRIPDRKT